MTDSHIRGTVRYWKASSDFSAVSDADLLWLIKALSNEDRNRHTAMLHHPSLVYACGQDHNDIVCHRTRKPSANIELVYHIDAAEQLVHGLGPDGVWNPGLHYVWVPKELQKEPRLSRVRYDVLYCPSYRKSIMEENDKMTSSEL